MLPKQLEYLQTNLKSAVEEGDLQKALEVILYANHVDGYYVSGIVVNPEQVIISYGDLQGEENEVTFYNDDPKMLVLEVAALLDDFTERITGDEFGNVSAISRIFQNIKWGSSKPSSGGTGLILLGILLLGGFTYFTTRE